MFSIKQVFKEKQIAPLNQNRPEMKSNNLLNVKVHQIIINIHETQNEQKL